MNMLHTNKQTHIASHKVSHRIKFGVKAMFKTRKKPHEISIRSWINILVIKEGTVQIFGLRNIQVWKRSAAVLNSIWQ